ncbi:hypothetical protein LUZ62_047774 [Rhynchospora pubera]|uniref:Late embryogenesis abundant protein LEA-2 subgroup domain-containing protein n=1 Tax=Rhynchospora pubera TaxID=906938 RepID=A0AAV8FTF1_9POAL|nr:hypothetical protein LUZ62_047774 [Rhynchospora pubera]
MADRVLPGSYSTAFGSPFVHPTSDTNKEPDPEPDPNTIRHPWLPSTETYIVQVAKDQIYRVPPPENAYLVERYRNQVTDRTKRSPVLVCLGWLCVSLLVLLVLFSIVSVIFFIIVRPGEPQFTVDQVHVKNSTAMSPEYDFIMSLSNPSKSMSYSFEKDGAAFLSYNGVNIAIGQTPELEQDSKSTSKINFVLHGLKIVVPKHIAKALKGSNDDLELELELEIRVSAKAWGLDVDGMHIAVNCDMTSQGLVKEPKIKTQSCKTRFRS